MTNLPAIGLLGITQELYDPVVPGITEYQRAFGAQLVEWFKDDLAIVFPGPAKNRAQLEQTLESFNRQGLDGVMVVMLTYAPSGWSIGAFRDNRLPLVLANLQPERTVTAAWNMASLTYNQGIHGVQDMANSLYKLGIRPPVISGDWKSDSFRRGLVDWAHASRAVQRMRKARIAAFGQMPGMGDITGDPGDIMQNLGPSIEHVQIGSISGLMGKVSATRVEEAMRIDRANFDVAPDLPRESHEYASRMYLALKDYLQARGYDGFCLHFDALGEDGRFKQIHMLAASNLMAEGYGYAAEGDVLCASLMVAGHAVAGDAHFTEMYALDYDRNAVLMSHMGEGNWKVGRRDRKPRLIQRELRIGGLGNPPHGPVQRAAGADDSRVAGLRRRGSVQARGHARGRSSTRRSFPTSRCRISSCARRSGRWRSSPRCGCRARARTTRSSTSAIRWNAGRPSAGSSASSSWI